MSYQLKFDRYVERKLAEEQEERRQDLATQAANYADDRMAYYRSLKSKNKEQ